jgi:hypothetical protein
MRAAASACGPGPPRLNGACGVPPGPGCAGPLTRGTLPGPGRRNRGQGQCPALALRPPPSSLRDGHSTPGDSSRNRRNITTTRDSGKDQSPKRTSLHQTRNTSHVQAWARDWAVGEALGVEPGLLNDDRIGRALDAIAPHLDQIAGSVGVAAIAAFGIDVTRMHWDMSAP